MTNFSYDLKKEICEKPILSDEQALSELSAIIKSCGEIRLKQNNRLIVLATEFDRLIDRVNKLLTFLYKETATESRIIEYKRDRLEIIFPLEISEKILIDTEVMFYDEEKYLCLNSGISKYIIATDEQMRAYIQGAILGCFTSNIVLSEENDDKTAKNSGYHCEFVFNSETMSQDFSELLSQYDILPKKFARKNDYVVYIKDFEQVCLLLETLSTPKCYLKLKDENTIREVRNQVNRQNNCILANSTKTVNASVKQLENIKIISETIGIEKLEEPLQEVCYLRLANPEESLDDLVKLSMSKITKSGLYHRFKKIEKIANELK